MSSNQDGYSPGHPEGRELVFVQQCQSGPPISKLKQQDADVDTIAIEKQEEWVKKRKVEQTKTKQIETRVRRQIMLQDGHVVGDSGPQVTTNTTEDSETKEEEHTERKNGGEDNKVPEGWVAIPGAVIVREKNEKKYNTRDEIDERLETEEVVHLGNVSNEELTEAIRSKTDSGTALVWRRGSSSESLEFSQEPLTNNRDRQVVPTCNKRVLHHSRKHKRIIDKENTQEKSEEKDGRVTTETTKHEHHEEFDDEELPDEEKLSDTSSVHEVTKETNKKFTHVKDEDQVEYVAVPRGGKLSEGIKLGRGPLITSETIHHDGEPVQNLQEKEASHPSNGLRKQTNSFPVKETALKAGSSQKKREFTPERKDALTKKPLDLEEEEETRKLETSRWLESHFGSESSHGGSQHEFDGDKEAANQAKTMPSQISSGGINVTMLSASPTSDRGHADFDEVDRPAAPTIPAPPPPPPPPMGTPGSRIYATPNRPAYSTPNNENNKYASSNVITSGRYAGYNDRIQVLPIGTDKIFLKKPSSSPPASPLQKTGSINGTPQYSSLNPKFNSSVGEQEANAVKRATSFNNVSKPYYPWMNREDKEPHQQPLSPNDTYQSTINNKLNDSDSSERIMKSDYRTKNDIRNEVQYGSIIEKRWPPSKPFDTEDTVKTPLKGTVIRLGPLTDENVELDREKNRPESPVPGEQSVKKTIAMINRSKSMLTPRSYYKDVAPSPPNHAPQRTYSQKTTSQMNLLNSSRQSNAEDWVPEREKAYFIDTIKPTPSLTPNMSIDSPKIIQTTYGKTPPPRPAPPQNTSIHSIYAETGNLMRHKKMDNMFASFENPSPPVRPERRKSKIRPKTDSGTQTIKNDMVHTLDRTRPMKKYYLGEDPFTGNPSSPYQTPVVNQPEQKKIDPYRLEEKPSAIQRTPKGESPGKELTRSQTLPRQTRTEDSTFSSRYEKHDVHNQSSSRYFSDQDRSINESFPVNKNNVLRPKQVQVTPSPVTAKSTVGVSRSQSFQVQNLNATRSPISGQYASTLNREVKNNNSPMYKSTSYLNRINDSFSSLKSPGIVTSISKSQLELNNISNDPNSSNDQYAHNSPLYTLPRKRSDKTGTKTGTGLQRSHSAVPQVSAERLINSKPSPEGGRGESFSSLHRRKIASEQAKKKEEALNQSGPLDSSNETNSGVVYQTSTKATHRSFRNVEPNRNLGEIDEEGDPSKQVDSSLNSMSLKDRIAKLETVVLPHVPNGQSYTLPRIVSGKTKGPPPPPPPRVSSAKKKDMQTNPPVNSSANGKSPEMESNEKRQKFLQGLLNTAPELFMHIHGDENLENIKIDKEDVIGNKSRPPRTPSPEIPLPPLTKPVTPISPMPNAIYSSTPSNRSALNRVYTSTPVLNQIPSSKSSVKKERRDYYNGNVQSPAASVSSLHNSSLLVPKERNASPSHSNQQLSLRRGSLNSNGSILQTVKIPAPEDYSETIRIKSSGDPNDYSHMESDSVQRYSKRTVPFEDGFSSETQHSTEKTTITRSQYNERDNSHPYNNNYNIRPQQSGGVIIQVRGNNRY